MTLRFAPARSVAHSPVARALARKGLARSANDNGDLGPADDAILAAALRHFGAHGLGAAIVALREAEQAREAGDETRREWWMNICQALDRRLAQRYSDGGKAHY